MCSAYDNTMLLINKINMLLIVLIVIINLIVNIAAGGKCVYWVDDTKWKRPLNRRNHQRGPQMVDAMEIVLCIMAV